MRMCTVFMWCAVVCWVVVCRAVQGCEKWILNTWVMQHEVQAQQCQAQQCQGQQQGTSAAGSSSSSTGYQYQ